MDRGEWLQALIMSSRFLTAVALTTKLTFHFAF